MSIPLALVTPGEPGMSLGRRARRLGGPVKADGASGLTPGTACERAADGTARSAFLVTRAGWSRSVPDLRLPST